MKKNNAKLILTLFSIILGLFISLQIKTKVVIHTPVNVKTLQVTKNQIDNIHKEIGELDEILTDREEKLEILENISKGDDNIIDILTEDMKINKTYSGESDLLGPGIVIEMYDNQEKRDWWYDINDDIIHDIDILNIINDLRVAGAEAISINNERVVSTSEIKCAGPVIRINDNTSATPFVIRAIGDPKLLMASVSAPGTNGDILKNVYNKGFDISVEDEIEIPAYNGMFDFKYAKPVGEGD